MALSISFGSISGLSCVVKCQLFHSGVVRQLPQVVEPVAPLGRADEHRPALLVRQAGADNLLPRLRLDVGHLVEHGVGQAHPPQRVGPVCAPDVDTRSVDERDVQVVDVARLDHLAPEVQQQVPDDLPRLPHRRAHIQHRRSWWAAQRLNDQCRRRQSRLSAAPPGSDDFEPCGIGVHGLLPWQELEVEIRHLMYFQYGRARCHSILRLALCQ